MSATLSPEDYAATGGAICPSCGSTALAFGLIVVPGGTMQSLTRRAGCTDCGARWDAVYALTGYTHPHDAKGDAR